MKNKIKINLKLLIPVVAIMVVMLVLVGTNLTYMQENVENIYNGCIRQFGWLFVITDLLCLVFAIWLMVGSYKDIRLGGEDCKPAFSTVSWSGMMFTTSCGAWLIVYGFLEPIYCAAAGPFEYEPMSIQAMEFGQAFAHFHWGPNAWGIYVPITVAIGYALYNRKRTKSSLSEACGGILKKTMGKNNWILCRPVWYSWSCCGTCYFDWNRYATSCRFITYNFRHLK